MLPKDILKEYEADYDSYRMDLIDDIFAKHQTVHIAECGADIPVLTKLIDDHHMYLAKYGEC